MRGKPSCSFVIRHAFNREIEAAVEWKRDAEVVPAQASCEEGGEMAGGKKRKRAITDASKIAAVVRKKQRAALVKQLQLRKQLQ